MPHVVCQKDKSHRRYKMEIVYKPLLSEIFNYLSFPNIQSYLPQQPHFIFHPPYHHYLSFFLSLKPGEMQFGLISQDSLRVSQCVTLIIVQLMCDHNKKSRIFCVTEDCDHPKASGCMDCIRKCHKIGLRETLLKEDELLALIKLYQVPNHIKEQRKAPIYHLYQMLTTCKNEICEQVDRYFGSMLNKIKYPFLYHENILQAYRIIRDKNYHKLERADLLSFYKTTKGTSSQVFLAKQTQFYQQYVRQTQDSLRELSSKLVTLEGLLNFKISKQTQIMHHDVVTEFAGLAKQNSPKEAAITTPRKLSDSEVEKIGKSPRLTDRLSTSYVEETIRPKQEMFLTPKRSEEKLDIIMEKTPSIVCLEQRSTQKIEENIFGTHKQQRPSSVSKVSYESSLLFSGKRESNVQRQDRQSIKLQKPSIIHVNKSHSQLQQYQPNNTSQTDSIFIRISQVSSPPVLNMESSLNEKMNNCETNSTIHQSTIADKKDPVKSKEENVKKRLADLIKEKSQKQIDKTTCNKSHEQTRHQSKLSRKNSKDDKDFPIASLKSKIQTRQSHFLSVSKRKANLDASFSDSLGKEVYEVSRDQRPKIISKSIKKQIPLPVSVKTEPTPINSQEQGSSSEKEIQMAAIFISGINQPSAENKIFFLEKYLAKYENNLTAIQYLSYLYLQQGKPKQCHNLCSTYLNKLSGFRDEKVLNNLVINNSAALNELGRYSQTIKCIEEKLRQSENAQMHKIIADAYFNIGVVDKAVYHYQRATKLNPQLDEAFYNLAVILYQQESYFNAKMNIDKALHLRRDNYYIELRAHIQERIQMNPKEQ